MSIELTGASFIIWPNKSTKPNQIINNNNLCENVTGHLRTNDNDRAATLCDEPKFSMPNTQTNHSRFICAKQFNLKGSFAIYSIQMNVFVELHKHHLQTNLD